MFIIICIKFSVANQYKKWGQKAELYGGANTP